MQDSKSPLGKTWLEITREERYFCAELFFEIRKDIKKFIKFLNEYAKLNLNVYQEWEIGYEVCFYRDYLFDKGFGVKTSTYHDKRTFDLCLFSNTHIIVIEAKVDQSFNSKQLKSLEDDVNKDIYSVLKLNKEDLVIQGVLLFSTKKRPKIAHNFAEFDWDQLSKYYNENKYFPIANEVPSKPKPKRRKAQS